MGGEVKESCGVCAVYMKPNGRKKREEKAMFYLYKMLLNLQNRGQLAAGMTTYGPDRIQLIDTYKGLGTVNEVFRISDALKREKIFERYKGTMGIGHTRYATSGRDSLDYAQPFERHHGRKWKWFSFCFNGNIANYRMLKEHLLKKQDYYIVYDTDTELMMHYISRELQTEHKPKLSKVFGKLSKIFDGAYNIAFLNAEGEMVVTRDPFGFRPMVYGETENAFLIASESNALVNSGVREWKDLQPGEMIYIYQDRIKILRYAPSQRRAHCMFEWVYFANVSSKLDGKSVYVRRRKLGEELARMETIELDDKVIVVPVPDTAKATGDAMAYKLGIPSKEGLIRNRHVGRTFIEGDASRRLKIKNKFSVLPEVLRGRKVILVDDSVVRGTTSKEIVRFLKEEGKAKEVHLRVSCPPIMGPCFYGIDMTTVSELLAPNFVKDPKREITEEEERKIAKHIGADSVKYMTKKGLIQAIGLGRNNLCMACLDTRYPTSCGKRLYQEALLNRRKKTTKRVYE